MLPESPRAKRLAIGAVVVIALVAVLLVSNWRDSKPTDPPPTVTVEAAKPSPYPTEPPYTELEARTFIDPAGIYTLTLPSEWTLIQLTQTGTDQLAGSLGNLPLSGPFAAKLAAAAAKPQPDLLAIRNDQTAPRNGPSATLMIDAMPRDGLYLEEYLSASAQAVAEIANTDGLTTTMRDDLHPLTLPAATLRFNQRSPRDDQSQTVYQAVLLDPLAKTLIAATFTTQTEDFDNLQAEFDAIVRAIELAPSP